ncbi:MAG: UDP-N-acetylmuramoyl-tripeptide--D-alanyl-D-alanine ligase [Acidobacteriota bacterium]|nr:UDP-N-acetylmuramoyl-tripeptide--D-alanyl-D-alanine ligase [Acidobacteriota bacterium]
MYDFHKAPAHLIEKLTDMIRVLDPLEHHITRDLPVGNFCWDNRQVKPGDVFVAIPGARVDGHRFVGDALAAGAAACLVSHWDNVGDRRKGCILVENTERALGYLAASHRRAMNVKIVGITGSVGKTTTKEILATLLSGVFRTKKSEGNLNSTIGLPVQLLKLRQDDQWMVAEMGMSYPGEIAALTKMVKPDIGVWTAVQAVHLANFNSIEGIARAKAELVDNMDPDRTLVYNRDDPLVTRFSENYPGRKIGYAVHDPHAEFRARIEPYPDWKGTRFDLWADNNKIELFLPIVGRFNAYNALAACTAASAAGVPPAELKFSLKTVDAMDGRSSLHVFDGDVRVVDDTYNSNPHAVNQVLRSFAALSPRTWRWIILGDMLEMGPREIEYHRALGRDLAVQGFDRITLVGPLCEAAYAALKEANDPSVRIEHFGTVDDAVAELDLSIPPRARIWAKASRGIRLEKVSRLILDRLTPPRGS